MMVGNNNLPELPKEWIWARLEELLDRFESGGRPKGGVRNIRDGIPSIGGEHLTDSGGFDFSKIRYVPIEFFENLTKGIITRGDILIVKDGATTGKTSIIRDDFPFNRAAINEHVFLARPALDVNNLYLFYYLFSPPGQQYVQKNFRGTAQGGITLSFASSTFVPLPPLAEQHRIIARLDELLTRLDAGAESLKKVKAQLTAYRQAVLKHAFEGKLTVEWREARKGEMEPASLLLERIEEERKKNAEGKFRELPWVDTADLPELPEDWVWTRVGMVSQKIQYGTSEKARGNSSGIPVLRMGNIQDGRLLFEDLKYFPGDWSQLGDFTLQDGDVVFNRTNSAELVGKTAVYKRHHPVAIFASYLIRVRLNEKAYLPDLLSCYINSLYGKRYIASVVSQQVGQANVNGTKLSLMPIPVPPVPEQHKIVEEIERRFSVADQMEKTVEQGLKQVGRLQQSILERAFEGKLVPQDPSDEPADRLLERIKAEKASRAKPLRSKVQ